MYKTYKLWLIHSETGKKKIDTFEAPNLESALNYYRRCDYSYEYEVVQIKEIKNEL